MRFKIGSAEIELMPHNVTTFVSRHTGATLRQMEIQIGVRGVGPHEELINRITEARTNGITSHEEVGDGTFLWSVTNSSYSYRDDGPNRLDEDQGGQHEHQRQQE